MYKQKAPIYKLLRSKAPKYRKFRLTDIFETNVDFSSRSNFANLGSFAKVSVPVESIIPCKNAIVFLVRVSV